MPSTPDRAKAIKEAELSVAGPYEARAGASETDEEQKPGKK